MKKLVLQHAGKLSLEDAAVPQVQDKKQLLLKVEYCAVCRTDAKMWDQGHRDLALPRVLGHEFVGRDASSGTLYGFWPGAACGTCSYCRAGRENLCDRMQITGFHCDGGFAEYVVVPKESLIPVTPVPALHLYCFAEPVGCICNGFERLNIGQGTRVIIYGGGVLGLLAALVAQQMGAEPLVIEQSVEKIARAQKLVQAASLQVVQETMESDFDCAVNACDSHTAFSRCLTKLRKGGQLAYFSGVRKNEEINFNLLNLIHYKELEVFGAYGPRRDHVVQATRFCAAHQELLDLLVEAIISLEQVPQVLPEVLSGKKFKYIIAFNSSKTVLQPTSNSKIALSAETLAKGVCSSEKTLHKRLQPLVERVRPVKHELREVAQNKIDLKTKPLGALGKIESLAVDLSVMQNTLVPQLKKKRVFVFAGDHGVVEEGVSAYPSKVTVQMVENFLAGGAAINVFCDVYQIDLKIVDMGVNGTFSPHPLLIDQKIARGTRNFAQEPAMSEDEALLSIERGAEVVGSSCTASHEIIGLGEMGIGNTTAATAVISAITGLSPQRLAGRGTGVDNEGLKRKIEVLEKTLAYHKPDSGNGLEILAKVGGFELGGICGAVLAGAANGSCVVLDGVISTAAGLLAYLICPAVKGYLVAGHKSVEHGQQAALKFMGLEPVLDMGMRLGEGTGAAMTIQVAELAAQVMCDMASFDEAGVDKQLA